MGLVSVLGNLLLSGSIAFLGLALLLQRGDYQPQSFTLPPPPKYTGALTPNVIKEPQYILKGQILSPESIHCEGSTLYTGLGDGRIVKIVDGVVQKSVRFSKHKNCDGSHHTLPYCGRPLGLRKLRDEVFVVADANLGVYTVDFAKGTTELILAADSIIDGRPAKFIDDLDIVDNDTLIVSDASTRYGFENTMKPLLEHASDGRVLQVKISNGKATTLLDGLNFPNGIQIHADRQSVLIDETGGARVIRYYFAGPKKGRQENFVENLPGFPDNIRVTASGTYFVALAMPRHPEQLSLFDKTQKSPWIRKILGEIMEFDFIREFFGGPLMSTKQHGLFVELNKEGEIIASYHDPEGNYIHDISQVCDDGSKYLYLGSYANDFIVRVRRQ
ncbi:Adipocyte plasma membrane-associated protein [Aphelenchoides avenae]|nr:Adipocyte plasma membrane-associated protein [Aphelenchus avenae]